MKEEEIHVWDDTMSSSSSLLPTETENYKTTTQPLEAFENSAKNKQQMKKYLFKKIYEKIESLSLWCLNQDCSLSHLCHLFSSGKLKFYFRLL